MNKSEAKAAAKKASDKLDAVADKTKPALLRLIDRIYDSKFTWLVLGAVAAFIGYKVIGLFV